MQVIADLLGKTDPYLTVVINCKLAARSLAPASHVSDLFLRVGNKYMSAAESTDTMAVAFLSDYAGSGMEPGDGWKCMWLVLVCVWLVAGGNAVKCVVKCSLAEPGEPAEPEPAEPAGEPSGEPAEP